MCVSFLKILDTSWCPALQCTTTLVTDLLARFEVWQLAVCSKERRSGPWKHGVLMVMLENVIKTGCLMESGLSLPMARQLGVARTDGVVVWRSAASTFKGKGVERLQVMVECCWFSIYAHEHRLWLFFNSHIFSCKWPIFPLYHAVMVLFAFSTCCMAKLSLRHGLRRSLDTCRCWVNRTSLYSGKVLLFLTHASWLVPNQ